MEIESGKNLVSLYSTIYKRTAKNLFKLMIFGRRITTTIIAVEDHCNMITTRIRLAVTAVLCAVFAPLALVDGARELTSEPAVNEFTNL